MSVNHTGLVLEDRGLMSPLSVEVKPGIHIGQVYNSWDKKYHLAEFAPYAYPPRAHLCGSTPANLVPSRERHTEGRRCERCFELAEAVVRTGRLDTSDNHSLIRKP